MEYRTETIRADEVLPGDWVYHIGADFSPWVRVRAVKVYQKWRILQTPYWATWLHPAEGIAVRRETMNEKKKWAPIICVDFDGVLHSYTSGWKGAGNIPDPPVEGAMKWLATAVGSGKAQIAIYSSRSKDEEGPPAMRRWLAENLVAYIKKGYPNEDPMGEAERVLNKLTFPTEKPAAIMTIDDRAHCFNGHFRPIEWYLNFKPWNKRSQEPNVPDYAQPGYDKNWNQYDEDLADQSLECLLDCLTVERDGFYIFEPSALEYMSSMFMEARKGAATYPERRMGVLREMLSETLQSEQCSTKSLDDADDREAVLMIILKALRRF